MTLVLAAAAAALFGCGTYLLLQRQLSRIVIGLGLLSHGANLLLVLSAGRRGEPTFVGSDEQGGFLDPLPQAFVLTAIVITFGVTSFLLAMAYRSYTLTRNDEVQDDIEDRAIGRETTLAEEVLDLVRSADQGEIELPEPEAAEGSDGDGSAGRETEEQAGQGDRIAGERSRRRQVG
jgi:multicomponent Na+:H+ antiporter subunit C